MRRKPRPEFQQERTRSKPKPVQRDRCGATGKVRYRSRGAARQALMSTKRAGNILGDERRQECRIYPCVNCGGFHLTSQPWSPPPDSAPRLTCLTQVRLVHNDPQRRCCAWLG